MHSMKEQLRELRELLHRLAGNWRLALPVLVCLALVLAAGGQLNLAFAVNNIDGDVVGYVSSPEELNAIVTDVQQLVSTALGHDWSAPELRCSMALGSEADTSEVMTEKLLERVDELQRLQLIYVDGVPVCGFATRQEALEAIRALCECYRTEDTEELRFLETVSIAAGYADARLTEDCAGALAAAVTVERCERSRDCTVLPYATMEYTDSSLYAEDSYVITAGQDGSETVERLTISRNGAVWETKELSRVFTAPVAEELVKGTRIHYSTGTYLWPVETGLITSDYGYRGVSVGSSFHRGIDIAGDYGADIYASDGGTVIFAGVYGGYGELIKVEHENGDITFYAHCRELLVEEGDMVEQGQVIARMGSTGVSTGVHLHFEVHPGGGDAVDPLEYLPEESPCTWEK